MPDGLPQAGRGKAGGTEVETTDSSSGNMKSFLQVISRVSLAGRLSRGRDRLGGVSGVSGSCEVLAVHGEGQCRVIDRGSAGRRLRSGVRLDSKHSSRLFQPEILHQNCREGRFKLKLCPPALSTHHDRAHGRA